MSFAVFKGETNIKDLVSRIFQLPDKTAKTAKQAADALLQANPQLKDLSKVAVGSKIIVPSNAPPLNPSESVPESVTPQFNATRQAQQSLYLVNQRLDDVDARGEKAVTALLALVQSDQAAAFAARSADLKEQMPLIVSSIQAINKATKSQADSREQTIAALQKSLESPPSTKTGS